MLYEAMDCLFSRKDRIEKVLARSPLGEGSLVLYDVTSTYFEGSKCPLAQWGGKKSLAQRVAYVDAEIVHQQMKKYTGNEYPVSDAMHFFVIAL